MASVNLIVFNDGAGIIRVGRRTVALGGSPYKNVVPIAIAIKNFITRYKSIGYTPFISRVVR